MGAQQVVSPASNGRGRKAAGAILLAACVVLLLFTVLAGAWMKPDLGSLGMDAFLAAKGAAGGVVLYLWLFSLPLAMILGALGVAIRVGVPVGRRWAFGVTGVLVLLVPHMAAAAIGEPVAAVFGTGGILIEVFLLLLLWFWARERVTLAGALGLAADLRLAGYVFFAFAAWDLCGIGAQPVHALDPAKMIRFGMRPLAIQMMYGLLAYLVVGWGLTFASHYVAARARERAAAR